MLMEMGSKLFSGQKKNDIQMSFKLEKLDEGEEFFVGDLQKGAIYLSGY